MKVGVYLGNNSSYDGGGFTFQETIADALLQSKFPHEFHIFHSNKKSLVKTAYHQLITASQKIFFSFFNVNLNIYKGELEKKIHKEKVDLVWFVTPEFDNVTVPFMITVWDLQHRFQPFFPEVSIGFDGKEWERRENYYRSILPRATYILTGTEIGKKELIKFYGIPEERIKILPFPTPTFFLKKNVNKKIKLKYNLPKNYLFYPANFWPHKNHISLLLALKILIETYKLDFSLVFTGSDKGNLEFIMNEARKLGIVEKVYFLGFVSKEELKELYKNAFALVFPSLFGPDNLPPLEAMACGCPVIAGEIPGAKEQFGNDTVLLVNPINEEEIAKMVKVLFRDKNLRNKLIEKGYTKVNRWTAESYIKEICKILDEFEFYRRCWR